MLVINARNVNDAWSQAQALIQEIGEESESRNGPVLVAPTPITTVYAKPVERVLWAAKRDANPFFHLLESLWMLAGRADVEWLAKILPRMADFSDNGKTFHGAYGYRWRNAFGADQLNPIIDALKKNPKCRRQVLQIWSARYDLGKDTKDTPCNLTVNFQVRDRYNGPELDMVVFNRSNDIVMGCYGANAVHFSFLHEYMAQRIGVGVGAYTQISCNWHAYVNTLGKMSDGSLGPVDDPYTTDPLYVAPVPLVTPNAGSIFDHELKYFMRGIALEKMAWRNQFFPSVAVPFYKAYIAWRGKEKGVAADTIKAMPQCDWKLAATAWMARRGVQV